MSPNKQYIKWRNVREQLSRTYPELDVCVEMRLREGVDLVSVWLHPRDGTKMTVYTINTTLRTVHKEISDAYKART